jgi:uncharacterized protein (DUF1015 family)
MAIIKPFKAVRPKPEVAAQVASLPYDVMNRAEAKQMAKNNNSFLHVSRSEINFNDLVDEHSQQVYDKAAQNFNRLIADKVLIQDQQPCYYIYAQTMNGRKQYGLVACSSIEDYFNDIIKKHEFTRPEKEQDRIEHMKTVEAHVGPIFLTYPENKKIDTLVNEVVTQQTPIYDFTAEDTIQHTVWLINQAEIIESITNIFQQEIPYTYIADGHHRTASAAKVGKQLKEENPNHTGEEEYNFFLSVLFPANQLAIMDYNRLVKDLNGLTAEDLLQKVAEKFEVTKTTLQEAKPAAIHHFGMYVEGQWYLLQSKPGTYTTDPIGVLDVTILSENILNPLLGIKDQRTDKRIDFVGGIRGIQVLQERVDKGEAKIAFALYPVSLQQLIDIADSGNVMPPKSTWFEPKLRDGLFSHLF